MTITTTLERPHGYSRYQLDHCRCYVCCFKTSEYNRARYAAIQDGTWRHDGDEVRAHLRTLIDAGLSYKRIAKASRVPVSTVNQVLYGRPHRGGPPPRTIRNDIAAKLLGIKFDPSLLGLVDAVGTARRIHALAALGHGITAIAIGLGKRASTISPVVCSGATPGACRVEQATVHAVTDLYDRWCLIRPLGSSGDRARRMAARRRWFSPFAWDDEQIDDPAGLPCVVPAVPGSDPAANELELQHAAAGHTAELDTVTQVELIRRLTVAGYRTPEIADLAGTSANNVGRLRSDHNIYAARGRKP